MKAFEILKKIVEIMQKNLKISIYDNFSSKIVPLPINEKFITVEVCSGNENKTLLAISCYCPKPQGPKSCKELTKKTIEILNDSKIETLNDVEIKNVIYDRFKGAYVQKCKISFKPEKEKKIPIKFGNEEIIAKEDLTLKFSRNISVYYSQLSGVQFKDLGKALRKVYGSAIVDNLQFQRLSELIFKGSSNFLTIEGQKFKAILTLLERKPKGEIFFNFLEVA